MLIRTVSCNLGNKSPRLSLSNSKMDALFTTVGLLPTFTCDIAGNASNNQNTAVNPLLSVVFPGYILFFKHVFLVGRANSIKFLYSLIVPSSKSVGKGNTSPSEMGAKVR